MRTLVVAAVAQLALVGVCVLAVRRWAQLRDALPVGVIELGQALVVERRLVGFLRPHWLRASAGVGVTLLLTGVGLAKPWPTKILVDDVLEGGGIGPFGRSGALAVAVVLTTLLLFLLSGALGLLQTQLLFGLAQRLIADLRDQMFGHLTRVSLRYHDERGASDSTYRITSDTYAVQTVLLDGLVPIGSAALALLATLAIMIRLDPWLALLSLISVPAAGVASRRFGARIRSLSLSVRQRESEVYSHAQVSLSGIRTVQAFARESYEAERFSRRTNESRTAMMQLVTQQTLFGLAVDFILALGLGLITWAAASRAIDGRLTTGEVLVFLAYAGGLYGPVAGIASVFGELQAAAAAASRVFEVLDEPFPHEPARAVSHPERARGEVRFEDVHFGYLDGHDVLHGIDVTVEPGQVVAVVGPTGAGKSTLMSLLLRLYDVRSGRVTLDGIDVRDVPLHWLRSQVALVPQDPALFPATVRENIRYGRLDATDEEVERAARDANLLDELLADPRGLDAPIGDAGVMLSGGQRQRVAIARALLRDAPVIVLDEPTSALDAATERDVMDAVARLRRGRTCLVIAHRLATVRSADRVLVIQDGRVEARGTHGQLIRRDGLYRDLHRARFGAQPPAAADADADADAPDAEIIPIGQAAR